MNFGSVHAAYLGVGAATEAIKKSHQAATDSKRCRSPAALSRTDRFRINASLSPLEVSSPQTKRSRQQSTIGTGSNGHSCTDSKGTCRNGIASYPNAEDVEKALAGCGVSQVLLPWLDSIEAHTSKKTTLPSNHHSDSESYASGVAAMELAMEACRISSPVCSDPNPPAVSSAPVSSTTSETVEVADPPEMLRLTTSTIIGQQSLIWNQIQLERQEHHVGVVPVETITTSPNPRALAGSSAAASLPTVFRNSRTIDPNRVNMGHSSRSAQVPQSHWSTAHFGARDRSQIEPVSRDASRSRTARPVPPTTVNSTQNLHTLARTSLASASPPTRGAEQTQDAVVHRYRYTPSPIPRDPAVFFESRQRRGVVDEPPSHAQPAARIRGATAAIQTTSLSAHNGSGTSTTAATTVPCLECQAPLRISTTSTPSMVVHCPSCGTMASLELILSLVGAE
jgi:hypothetical protein